MSLNHKERARELLTSSALDAADFLAKDHPTRADLLETQMILINALIRIDLLEKQLKKLKGKG